MASKPIFAPLSGLPFLEQDWEAERQKAEGNGNVTDTASSPGNTPWDTPPIVPINTEGQTQEPAIATNTQPPVLVDNSKKGFLWAIGVLTAVSAMFYTLKKETHLVEAQSQ